MLRALFYAMLAAAIGSAALAADPQQKRMDGAHFVGAVGCKSSSCHGGAGEKRSQYITWLRHDVHTRAYAILTNARSERMADALKLPPAQQGLTRAGTSARCTVCHSPFQAIPQAQRLPGADPTESVSCESCHGPASGWLRGHTRPDWTYATRVGAGMRDLKSFYVRANTCVACHQNLDADIAAAGHPELSFELDGQSVAQPKHWKDDAGTGATAWLVGQAVALREISWRLSLHPHAETKTRAGWQALVWLLAEVTSAERTLLPIDAAALSTAEPSFTRVQQQADALARRASGQTLPRDLTARLLRHLAGLDSAFTQSGAGAPSHDVLFRRAERLTLALERLTNALEPGAGVAPVSPELRALRQSLASEANFDPAQFARQLLKLRISLER